MHMTPAILLATNHCLAVAKPARMPVTDEDSGDLSLVEWARDWIRVEHGKPGNVFLEAAHRIDRPVSGVVLFARTSKAASRLTAAFRMRDVEKTYLAVVRGTPSKPSATLVDWLVKDRESNISRVVPAGTRDARECTLTYSLVARGKRRDGLDVTLLKIEPLTGRPHQIRVQLAFAGMPIVGDVKYGGPRLVTGTGEQGEKSWIALHSSRLVFPNPTAQHEALVAEAPLPDAWPSEFGSALFGASHESSAPRE